MHALIVTSVVILAVAEVAWASPESAWKQFRERSPYHTQVIALGEPEADGSRPIIISEPPPHITLEKLATAYEGRLVRLRISQQDVGFDGWVKDIVGSIPAGDDVAVQSLVADLSRDLFGTSYKAYSIGVNDLQTTPSRFDLSVGAADLRSWLGIDEPEQRSVAPGLHAAAWIVGGIAALVVLLRRRKAAIAVVCVCIVAGYWTREQPVIPEAGLFQPLHGGAPRHLKRLMQEGGSGVYFSTTPGLVALVVPQDRPLNESAVAIREFALDTDLVLGAVGNWNRIAILGRERQVPVSALPPLRTETILQLAAAHSVELAQSYERTRLLAGRFGDDNRDWAPIYLSDELHDTEYGSLLNITDQLLKSWSEEGQVQYIKFAYPKPDHFPFEKGLLAHSGATTVTYNWNTKGVGYMDARGDTGVLAFTRTGALPVDYLGEQNGRLRQFEDRGSEFFASVGDPNLARVVQYAGLYQIFRAFSIFAEWSPSTRERRGADALRPLIRRAVELVRDVDIDAIAARLPVGTDSRIQQEVEDFREIQEGLREYITAFGDGALEDVVSIAVNPRGRSLDDLSEREKFALGLAAALGRSQMLPLLTDGAQDIAMFRFAFAEGRNDPAGWIKTPSLVVSWNTGPNAGALVGGHNLSSRISRYIADDTLRPGTVRVAGEAGDRVVYYHPNDAGAIRRTVRSFARNQEQTPEELAGIIQRDLTGAPRAVQPLSQALHLGSTPPAAGARGLTAAHATRLVKVPAWIIGESVPQAHADALAAIQEASVFGIVIERAPGRYLISRSGQSTVIEAADSAGALDAVVAASRSEALGRTVHLHFKGLEADQARQFSRATEIHAVERRSVTVRTSIESAGGRGPVVLGEIRRGRWNWNEARAQIANVKSGSVRRAIDVDVHVPGTGPAGLRMRVTVTFKRAITMSSELLARLQTAIESWVRALAAAPEELDVLIASRRIVRDLKLYDDAIANAEIRLTLEAGEIQVVRHDGGDIDSFTE